MHIICAVSVNAIGKTIIFAGRKETAGKIAMCHIMLRRLA